MYILIPVIFLIIFIPFKVNIKLNGKLKDDKLELEQIENMPNFINIKILYILTILKKPLLVKGKKRQKKKKKIISIKTILKIFKVDKLLLTIGINSNNYILNSYLNAIINTSICTYINLKQKKFNINNLYYQVYTSSVPLVVNLDLTGSVSLISLAIYIIKDKTSNLTNKLNFFCNNG